MTSPILPGATIGILGSGQLGRMLAMAARTLGYRVHVFSPDSASPAGQIADREITADYHDLEAVRTFAREVDVVTFEFENVPAVSTTAAAEMAPVRPDGQVLHTTQNRLREKQFLKSHGFPVTPFAPIHTLAELEGSTAELCLPGILKTAAFGYDGKGQTKIRTADEIAGAFGNLRGQEGIYEAFVDFEKEISVIAARSHDGAVRTFPVFENEHANHILDTTVCPAFISEQLAREAADLGAAITEKLEVVGLLTIEMFLTRKGSLVVNELAPRTHNSGHLTIEACRTSQFEQQLRAVCGLPLGSVEMAQPAAMANLLGDIWQGGEPNWAAALAEEGVKLHLYGKAQARPGRKMGHLTALAGQRKEALATVRRAREKLASL